eukprot:3937659-Rhodomonas_salina.1
MDSGADACTELVAGGWCERFAPRNSLRASGHRRVAACSWRRRAQPEQRRLDRAPLCWSDPDLASAVQVSTCRSSRWLWWRRLRLRWRSCVRGIGGGVEIGLHPAARHNPCRHTARTHHVGHA